MRLAPHGRENAARARVQRQIGDDAQHWLFRRRQIIDQPCQIIFQILLTGIGEKRDHFDTVDKVCAHQTKINYLAFADGLRDQTLRNGLILGFGKRCRIDNLQINHAIGGIGHFFQHVAHALGIYLQARLRGGQIARIVKFQRHRLFQPRQNIMRAGAQRIKALLGQVEPRTAQKHGSE